MSVASIISLRRMTTQDPAGCWVCQAETGLRRGQARWLVDGYR